MANRWKTPMALLLVLAVTAVACGGDTTTDTTGAEPTTATTEPATSSHV